MRFFLLLLVFLPWTLFAGGKAENKAKKPMELEQTVANNDLLGTELSDLLKQARQTAPELRIKRLETLRQAALVDKARAGKLPKSDLTVSTSYMLNPPEGMSFAEGSLGYAPNPGGRFPTPIPDTTIVLIPNPENTYFTVKPSLNLPLFTWGKLDAAIKAASLQKDMAESELNNSARTLDRDIKTAWAGLALSKESSNLLAQGLELLKIRQDDAQSSFDQGLVNKETVLEAQSAATAIMSQVTKSQQAYKSALQGLAVLTGIPYEKLAKQSFSLNQESELLGQTEALLARDDESLFNAALALDAGIQKTRQQLGLANIALAVEKASAPGLPNIALQVQLDISGQRIPFTINWTDTWDINPIFSLGFSAGILDFGHGASVKANSIQLEQAKLGLETQIEALYLRIQTLREKLSTSLSEYRNALAKRVLQAEKLKNAQSAFDNGLATRSDLSGAKMLSIQADLEHLIAQFNLAQALIESDFLYAPLNDF